MSRCCAGLYLPNLTKIQLLVTTFPAITLIQTSISSHLGFCHSLLTDLCDFPIPSLSLFPTHQPEGSFKRGNQITTILCSEPYNSSHLAQSQSQSLYQGLYNLALYYLSDLVFYNLPSPCSLYYINTSLLNSPDSTKHAPISGPLHLLFLLISTWLTLARFFTLSSL